jgi:GNAT superfamily N-acetyltransferase
VEPPAFPRLTGTATVSVRPARAGDAADMARIQVVTWRTAYRTLLPPEVLDEWDEPAAADVWRAAVVAPPTPAHGVLVAVDGDAVVGFAAYGPPEVSPGEPSLEGPTTEVATLLVEPRWGRRGHGSRLLAAVADMATASGAAHLAMWVPDADTVTARFLESAGWARAGSMRTLETGSEPLREVRWHAALDEGGGR